MKVFLVLAAVVGVLLGLFLGASALRRDAAAAETPGTVVERFLRQIERERYEKATELLAADLESAVTSDALRAWDREARAGLGDVERVHAETEWIAGEKAEATGVIESDRRERRLRFGLKREEGRWAIDRLDEFWTDPASSGRPSEKWRERPGRARRTSRAR